MITYADALRLKGLGYPQDESLWVFVGHPNCPIARISRHHWMSHERSIPILCAAPTAMEVIEWVAEECQFVDMVMVERMWRIQANKNIDRSYDSDFHPTLDSAAFALAMKVKGV